MARQTKPAKKAIIVFCEGESEQAYVEFLRGAFSDRAVFIKGGCCSTNLFSYAENRFQKEPRFRDRAEVTDEVWFFFDVEHKSTAKKQEEWKKMLEVVQTIRPLRCGPGITVRLLMTTGCLEYWLLLHYELSKPVIQTPSQKRDVLQSLLKYEPSYQKGDPLSTGKIAKNYPAALEHGATVLMGVLSNASGALNDTDARNRWLYLSDETFTTVHEAVKILLAL